MIPPVFANSTTKPGKPPIVTLVGSAEASNKLKCRIKITVLSGRSSPGEPFESIQEKRISPFEALLTLYRAVGWPVELSKSVESKYSSTVESQRMANWELTMSSKFSTRMGISTAVSLHSKAKSSAVTNKALGFGGGGFTVTVNEQFEVLPLVSVAEALTVVMPTGNVLPEAGLLVGAGGGASQLSVTVGAA